MLGGGLVADTGGLAPGHYDFDYRAAPLGRSLSADFADSRRFLCAWEDEVGGRGTTDGCR